MSRPGSEPGSQDLASCAITTTPLQHDTTGPRHRAFDVLQGSCYIVQSTPPKNLLIFHSVLIFPVKPTLSATVTPVQVLQNNPALLAVTVQDTANPELEKDNFTWTFKGNQQNTSYILENGNLQLPSAQPSQTGVHTCTAVNTGGSGFTTVRLEVLGEKLLLLTKRTKMF